jgi:osmoprotectant transport system substrate-binding protein
MKAPLLKRLCGYVLGAILFCACVGPSSAFANNTIIVGSKNFLENRLLAEMFAQLIEAQTTLTVERRLGLAGTQICFQALTSILNTRERVW